MQVNVFLCEWQWKEQHDIGLQRHLAEMLYIKCWGSNARIHQDNIDPCGGR